MRIVLKLKIFNEHSHTGMAQKTDFEYVLCDSAHRKKLKGFFGCVFFFTVLAKSPTPDRSSDEQRAGRYISNALFAEVAKKHF